MGVHWDKFVCWWRLGVGSFGEVGSEAIAYWGRVMDVHVELKFIRGSNALHKSKPFDFPVHLLPNGQSISPYATAIFSRSFAFFSSLRNHCTLWDLNPGPCLCYHWFLLLWLWVLYILAAACLRLIPKACTIKSICFWCNQMIIVRYKSSVEVFHCLWNIRTSGASPYNCTVFKPPLRTLFMRGKMCFIPRICVISRWFLMLTSSSSLMPPIIGTALSAWLSVSSWCEK